MIKQYCIRTYDDDYSYLNKYLAEGWRVVVVTPKPHYNEYILEKKVEPEEVISE